MFNFRSIPYLRPDFILPALALGAVLFAAPAPAAQERPTLSDEELSPAQRQLPDILDCTQLDWMENCEAINIQQKRFPTAPIRVVDSSGYEHNFPPGTPSPVINFLVSRTPAAAAAFADYLEQTHKMSTEAANLYTAELNRRGGLAGIPSAGEMFAKFNEKADIHYENLQVYVIYDSNCPACKAFYPVVSTLQKRHPKLRISMLQINDDPSAMKMITDQYKLNGMMLSGKRRDDILRRIEVTPTVWYMDTRSRKTYAVKGVQGLSQIEQKLAEVSK